MALQVSADAIRALIPDGVYSLQVLEQRDQQRVVLTFVLLARGGGHTLQIETTDASLPGLFQSLLATAASRTPPANGTQLTRSRAKRSKSPERPLVTDAANAAERAAVLKRPVRRDRRAPS